MMDLSLYQILSLLGIPTIIATVVTIIVRQERGVRKGVQALLRAQLIHDWNYYNDKGYAPIYARENFENVYQQYHALGANGVMDDLRNKFLALPTERPSSGSSS